MKKQLFCNPSKKKEFKEVEVPTVYGLEKVPAVVMYLFEIEALGYVLDASSNKVVPLSRHIFELYILRSYPFPMDRRLGAPLRIVWVTPIFHPNIAPGVEYEGTGVVCWRAFSKWISTMNLKSILEGVKLLVENPNPDDPLRNPPICLEAARYFKENPPPRILSVKKREGGGGGEAASGN
ncbi:MAG: ubiquitin-conjugating enzyme E2 [Desulfurococcaceae archaeon]